MPQTFRCPKCGQPCAKCGEAVENGVRLDIFQCEAEGCAVAWEVGGSTFPAAYTLVVGPEGVPRDPAEPFDPLVN